MTAPLSPREAAIVARFDEAGAAPESLTERVARALGAEQNGLISPLSDDDWEYHFDQMERDDYRRLADAAIAVMRGES